MYKSNRCIECTAAVTYIAVTTLLAGALLSPTDAAQAATHCRSSHSPDVAKALSFELPSTDKVPGGWHGAPEGTVFLVSEMSHKEQKVVVLKRAQNSASGSSYIFNCTRMDFTGETITFQAYLRTENVDGFASLWLSERGAGGTLAVDNLKDQNLHGTTGWKKYSVTLPRKASAAQLTFGALLNGSGKVWVAGLELWVDGKPIWKAPQPDSPFYTDHQFDHGSGITIKTLNKTQIANLVILGKVWGFLKYYHPTVTAGMRQWEYDLFRILPTILKTKDRESANAALVQWIKKLGPVKPCNPCAHVDKKDLALRPDLDWIEDEHRLGKKLSSLLQTIRDNRRTGEQFYVALAPKIGNPVFKHERSYDSVPFPDSGFQLLALYRFWNIIEYWYPYRNIIGEDWDKVLAEFIPRLALAKSRTAYERQMMALVASIHDTHAYLGGSDARPPVGKCHLPVRLRFVQSRPVVTEYTDGVQADSSPMQIGDVITHLDGHTVTALIKQWSPYYSASNKAALKREIATFMTRGSCGDTMVAIRRNGHTKRITAKRVPIAWGDLSLGTHDLPGPAFRLLSPQVAYLKASSIKKGQKGNYFKQAAGTKGLIIDLRGYPSVYYWKPASHLINHPASAARFTKPALTLPGAFRWTPVSSVNPGSPYYAGKVIVLVDSITQSYGEFLAMGLRAAGAVVVGSTTAGADGNVSSFYLPGGLRTRITGIGVFYPDKAPTQRVGIVPDVVVKPTIADIRAGRDPVLEKAIRLILGPKVSAAQIRKMYQTRPAQSSKMK